MEFEFVVEMNLVQMGTNEFFPQLIRLAANERHLQSRPYSNQKLGRRDQSAASSRLLNSSCPSRGDLFPPILVMEAAENHASHNLAVLVIRTEIGREVSTIRGAVAHPELDLSYLRQDSRARSRSERLAAYSRRDLGRCAAAGCPSCAGRLWPGSLDGRHGGVGLDILATGNYNWFNLQTILLCLLLFDDAVLQRILPERLIRLLPARDLDHTPRRVETVIVGALAVLTVFCSLVEMDERFGDSPPTVALAVDRLIAPLHIVSAYGLFAVMTTKRDEIVIEGSEDRIAWREYEFRYKPGDVARRPRWNILQSTPGISMTTVSA